MSSLKRMDAGTTEFIGPQTLSFINYYGCAGSIVFDNVTATLASMYIGHESAGVNPTAEIKNGAVVKNISNNDYESETSSGIRIGASKTIPGTMSIGGASQLSHVGLAVRENSRLSVGGNSTLSFSRPLLNDSLEPTSVFGNVAFDGGTLKSFDNSTQKAEDTRKWAQWFNGVTNLYVGSNGITIQAPSALASLWPRLTADAGSSGASVTKTGTGALARITEE